LGMLKSFGRAQRGISALPPNGGKSAEHLYPDRGSCVG
jgi:hypothetical protein